MIGSSKGEAGVAGAARAPGVSARRTEAGLRAGSETWLRLEVEGLGLAVPLERVVGVVGDDRLRETAEAPPGTCGVVDLLQGASPVIDLGRHLEVDSADRGEAVGRHRRIVLATSRGRSVGLLADVVTELVEVDRAAIQSVPRPVRTARSARFLGFVLCADEWLILLDLDRLFS